MSKTSNLQKGESFELETSKIIHKEGIPFLISSYVLRDFGCGQVDLCVVKNNSIYLYELKSAGILSKKQNIRLNKSADFLSALLEKNVFIKLIFAK